MVKKTKKHITYSYGIYNDTGESYLKGYNVSEFTENRKFNGNRFLSISKIIILIALSVLLFSWGSRGFIDSKYINSKRLYTVNEYVINDDNSVSTESKLYEYYDYDWTIKINQLNYLRNVFTLPDSDNDSFYQRFSNDNLLFIQHLYDEGFLEDTQITTSYYNNIVRDLMNYKYNYDLGYSYTNPNSIFFVISNAFNFIFNSGNGTHFCKLVTFNNDTALAAALSSSDYFSSYDVNTFNARLNMDIKPLLYFCHIDNGSLEFYEDKINDVRDDFTKNLYKVFILLSYPFICLYNFMYDLGVLFRFAIVW